VGATFRVALLSDHGGQHFHADKKEVGKGNLVVPRRDKAGWSSGEANRLK
jgi:hypothetical protein